MARRTDPVYTLRWDTEDRERTITGSSRRIHAHTAFVHRLGLAGMAWDIAVHDESGTDVTARFFNHLDQQTAQLPQVGDLVEVVSSAHAAPGVVGRLLAVDPGDPIDHYKIQGVTGPQDWATTIRPA
ncbi:hypothetical protein [Streptomyces sp. A012304]|jgi:hypothetical protein|uniref:hypothetical protein n=1 Tax=Streptomyces sp. A012304 TaxID=375446 RepID=UPI00222EF757|nr:hypothetical protein [Streptomyces sp. A012304]GKQ35178.1 hypothetical protein ALMP_17240 [Streptomyces sp. A012304]